MSSIKVTMSGELEEYLAKLQGIENLDRKGLSNAIAEAMKTGVDDSFDSETAPDGTTWPKSVRAAASGGKTLTKSSGLRNSINTRATEEGAEVGTNLIYAATHQFGANRTIRARNKPFLAFQVGGVWRRAKSVNISIPARPFLGISDATRQDIMDMVGTVLEEA